MLTAAAPQRSRSRARSSRCATAAAPPQPQPQPQPQQPPPQPATAAAPPQPQPQPQPPPLRHSQPQLPRRLHSVLTFFLVGLSCGMVGGTLPADYLRSVKTETEDVGGKSVLVATVQPVFM